MKVLSTSMLTWAAAQDNIPIYELIRALTPIDEARIEAAYAEWRRRAAAGERRHKVDWRTYPIQDVPTPAEVAEPAPAPTPVKTDEAVEADETISAPIEDAEEDADTPWEAADAVEQILAVEEPEYISLDDFNLEPSEEEMREMERVMAAEPVPESAVIDDEPVTAPTVIDAAPVTDEPTVTAAAPEEEVIDAAAPEQPIEQRIDKLGKDATPALYESILASMAGDVDTLKAVTDAVIRDHTKRHRGTAAQRLFLAWLNEYNTNV